MLLEFNSYKNVARIPILLLMWNDFIEVGTILATCRCIRLFRYNEIARKEREYLRVIGPIEKFLYSMFSSSTKVIIII